MSDGLITLPPPFPATVTTEPVSHKEHETLLSQRGKRATRRERMRGRKTHTDTEN